MIGPSTELKVIEHTLYVVPNLYEFLPSVEQKIFFEDIQYCPINNTHIPDSTSLFDVMFTSGRRIFKSVCSSAIRL